MALNRLNLLRPLLVRQLRPSLSGASRIRAPVLHPGATCSPAVHARLYATKKAKGQRRRTWTSCARTWAWAWLDVICLRFFPSLLFLLLSLFVLQAKAKGQSSKVNINSTLVEDIISLDEVKADMTAVLDALKDDFARSLSVRTSPGARLFFLGFLLSVSITFNHSPFFSAYTQRQQSSRARYSLGVLASCFNSCA